MYWFITLLDSFELDVVGATTCTGIVIIGSTTTTTSTTIATTTTKIYSTGSVTVTLAPATAALLVIFALCIDYCMKYILRENIPPSLLPSHV